MQRPDYVIVGKIHARDRIHQKRIRKQNIKNRQSYSQSVGAYEYRAPFFFLVKDYETHVKPENGYENNAEIEHEQ